MSVLPTVEPQRYSEHDLAQVDELLALGARRGMTAGVLALRRALEAQRELLALATQFQYLVPPRRDRAPVTERRQRPGRVIERENAEAPPCRHTDTNKGPCQRAAHPDKPRAHEYASADLTVRRTRRAPVAVPGATFSAAS